MQNNIYEYHNHLSQNIPMLAHCFHWGRTESSTSNWHTNIELHYLMSGTAHIICNTEIIDLQAGDAAIINSNMIHRIIADSFIDCCCMIINHKFIANCGIELEKFRFANKTNSKSTAEIIEKVIKEHRNSDFLASAKMQMLTLELIIDLCTNHMDNNSSLQFRQNPAEKHIKTAIGFINKNLSQTIGLTEIAEATGITKNYLASEFKKHTGQTVITYLNNIRCQNAASLIANGMSVTEAALESGFESLPYFSRTYKKLFGVPPSKIK